MEEVVRAAAESLARAGIESPLLEAQILMARAIDRPRIYVVSHPEHPLTPRELASFRLMMNKRISRYPLAYITGRREFYGLDLDIRPGVLVPRQETEVLVEECLRRVPASANIADIGAGSGAVAVAIAASAPEARVYATEVSREALEVAQSNIQKHSLANRVTLLPGDLVEPLEILGLQFDAIVSNPPYIPSAEIDSLQPEVRDHEPRLALDGGPDGLDVIRRLLPRAARLLRKSGFAAVEVGAGQADAVCRMAAGVGYTRCETAADLAGISRVVLALR